MIKKWLRLFLINCLSLWLTASVLSGVNFKGGGQTLLLTALVLTIVNFTIKPLIGILLLPINLITLGAFRWLVNVLTLYLVMTIVPHFEITSFLFPGFSYRGFVVPTIFLTSFWAVVLTSFLLSLITSLLTWLAK